MECNFDDPFLPPSALLALCMQRGRPISKRMVSHLVQNTIGEASVPADGRGTRQMFSIKDLLLINVGLDLQEIGLSPKRVRLCVSTVRKEWSSLLSGTSMDLSKLREQQLKWNPFLYLVAMASGSEFSAAVKSDDEITKELLPNEILPIKPPIIVYNLSQNLASYFVSVILIILVTEKFAPRTKNRSEFKDLVDAALARKDFQDFFSSLNPWSNKEPET